MSMLKDNTYRQHEGINSNYADAQVVMFGVPFDGTASFRPGTRFGPGAVCQALDGLETFSPYQNKDMADYLFCDLGDMELPFGNKEAVIELVKKDTAQFLQDGKKSLTLGGEHLVSLPVIIEYIRQFPDLQVIHLDAHADLRDDYLGEKLSHATVMRRVYDELLPGALWQYGIRSGTREEFEFGKTKTNFVPFTLEGIENAVTAIGQRPVYLSLDLDILDPSVLSGTGTPEPGGVDFKELLSALLKLKHLNIVGADIVELSPHYDQSGVSTAVACKLVRELLLLMVD